MIRNREGHVVELNTVAKVDISDDGFVSIGREDGYTFGIRPGELKGFVPQVGDPLVLTTRNFSNVLGIIINGQVIRNQSEAEWRASHAQWLKERRLEKLERYIKEGDALKARVRRLPPALRERMNRFDAESGVEFWIEDAFYEMYAMEGAAALVRAAARAWWRLLDSQPNPRETQQEFVLAWIARWEKLSYKAQMRAVPDFGDGHSGNTADAAIWFAKRVAEGEPV